MIAHTTFRLKKVDEYQVPNYLPNILNVYHTMCLLAESYFDVLKRHQQMLMITPETIPDQYMIRFTCLEHNQVIDQHHFFSLAMQPIA